MEFLPIDVDSETFKFEGLFSPVIPEETPKYLLTSTADVYYDLGCGRYFIFNQEEGKIVATVEFRGSIK